MGSYQQGIKILCKQTAVYWADPQPDGFGGYTYLDPVEIKVFWAEKIETIADKNGQEMVSKAQVIVLQDIDDRGMLFLGELDDLDSASEEDPKTILNAFEVQAFEKVPIPTTGDFHRMVYL